MTTAINNYILKSTSFCNINCSYCYIFNLKDTTFRTKAKVMPLDVLDAAAAQISELAVQQKVKSVSVTFHGGEPMLAGPERFAGARKGTDAARQQCGRICADAVRRGPGYAPLVVRALGARGACPGQTSGPPSTHGSWRVLGLVASVQANWTRATSTRASWCALGARREHPGKLDAGNRTRRRCRPGISGPYQSGGRPD
ncbi:hypothetical protein [Pyxidicoccus sp. MSG2]|uniref:hypothetical protein n=1 Tax=Pyxidicoccus sp. MSG2 TaxID=2996790 RepID=UPI002270C2D2|nr:hypothetical protein [Pyxidicoccus sp. MSG2]MCY1023418.1 hypothetical protein [Pyxidicoccus sp. MSG2]